jgi:hypothetical protein
MAEENPGVMVAKFIANIPWYIIKFFDWLFTLFTAFIVFITK